MPGPTKRKGSENWYFRRRLTKGLTAIVRAMPVESRPRGWSTAEIWISLGTPDRDVAKVRYVEVASSVDKQIAALTAEPRALSNKEIHYLAGLAYSDLVGAAPDHHDSPALWDKFIEIHERRREAGQLEKWIGPTIDYLLLRQGWSTDDHSRALLVEATDAALIQGAEQMRRHASGDFTPDPLANRFPVEVPAAASAPPRGKPSDTSFATLVDGWSEAIGPRLKSAVDYRSAFVHFATFLGHDDAALVTTADVIKWIDHLEAGALSVKTINAKRLTPLNTVFNWAVRRQRLSVNVAKGLRSERNAPPRTRSPSFTKAEVRTILTASVESAYHRGKTSAELLSAYRWVPWMCAYSGARVAEITQLRGSDFHQEGSIWVMTITPEAGAVKNDSPRIVPVHPDLIAQGLTDFVHTMGAGPLFYSERRLKKAITKSHPSKTVAQRMATWVRTVGVTDPKVQPNHGWRHLFITMCREYGVSEDARYFMVGHAKKDQGQAYGGGSAAFLYRELCKLPAFKL